MKLRISAILLSLLCVFFAGCSQTHVDPYKGYRQYSSRAIYNKGVQNLVTRHFDKATKDFEALNGLYPFGPFAEPGQVDLIYAYYKNDDKAAAVAASDRYIRLYPQNSHVAYAYYIRGIVQFKMGLTWLQRLWGTDPAPRSMIDKKQAFLAFSQLARFYPHSPYTPDAVMHMRYIRNELARKDLLIGKYYWDRGAFVASADRASFVVQHFQGTPASISALAMMVKSYHKLGLTKMEDSTRAILQANYPRIANHELKKIT
jgi:outer membrane protein assembly factor BamD